MPEDAQPFKVRLESNSWQVNVGGEGWIDVASLRDAETIAAGPLLMSEVMRAHRGDEGAATECEKAAQVFEKYELREGAACLRRLTAMIRAKSDPLACD